MENIVAFNAHINDPMPRFPVASVIEGIPCIKKMNFDTIPYKFITVYSGADFKKGNKEHRIHDTIVQEVHNGDLLIVLTIEEDGLPMSMDLHHVLSVNTKEVVTLHVVM